MSKTVPSDAARPTKRFLEPSDRVAEVLFGLIMVLTFTGSLSAGEADRADVRGMLIGALGCNFAWGVIDAILYLMGCLAERGRSIRALRALRTSRNAEEGRAIIANVLPPLIATMMSAADYERLREKLLRQAEPPDHPRLTRHDVLGAAGVFLWVFATTFPVAIPFLFLQDVERALRTSNAIAVALLFVNGYAYGRCSEYHPWWTGLAMVMLGSTLVGFTIALGG